ncbi:ATPase domain-containing protein [Halosimplex pelagicum]|uniref:Recombinase RecA n=1 Tax=Halosimplex pelagicum TaxID=869886 RepID=A0A7D5PBW9_9EURY|nr:ATPase domain-containing protein [Halosimplex pelagicum]QLH82582.1 recombinase RecA [Halosimplex pelagicum]
MAEEPDAATGSPADGVTPTRGTGPHGGPGEESGGRGRCDYCRLPVPGDPVVAERDGHRYTYCCAACREAADDADQVFTQFHGCRRVPTGVAPLDESLPQGIPRNSFVLLTDLAGTRTESIQAELVWRALRRGEPAVFVSFLEPPMSVVQEFVTLDWNVLPYLESGQLQILDCFTYRLENRERMYDRLNDWNAFLSETAADATTQVRDPTELGELHNRIDDLLEDRDMEDRGVVVVDSLTEFGSLVQPVQAYDFLKDVRAEVCKSRFVPIYAGATVTGEDQQFPHDLNYMVDGIVELNLDEELVEGSLMKQIRVRKMSGVLTLPKWTLYEYTAGEGIVTIELHEGPPEESDGSQQGATAQQGAGQQGAGQGSEQEDPGQQPDGAGGGSAGDGFGQGPPAGSGAVDDSRTEVSDESENDDPE